jgi:hypothetical protein
VSKPQRTAREELERAMWVSFKLPEQADALLDAYRLEVLKEAASIVELTPCPVNETSNWHIYATVLKRAAYRLDPTREAPW